ncbi:MAG: hypothetical protein AAGA96_07185 [Verrucomicrobiota bacterium]
MTRKKLILIVATLMIAGVSVAGYLKREGIANKVKSWRASSLVADSKKASEEGEWKESTRLLKAAWQLSPGRVDLLRHWFSVGKNAGSSELLAVAQALFQHPEATAEDRQEVMALFLVIGDRLTFARLLAALPEADRDLPEVLDLEARFLLANGQAGNALERLRRLEALKGEIEDRLLLATTLAQTPSEEGQNQIEAQEMIAELFFLGEDPQLALGAYFVLRQMPPESWQLEAFAEASDRLETIAKTTEIPPEIMLLDADRRLLAKPGDREVIFEETVSQLIEAAPAMLGNWLVSQGHPERVLEEIATDEAAEESPDLFVLRGLALIHLGEWESVREMLTTPHPDLPETTVLAYRGITASQLKNETDAEKYWEEALSAAMSDRSRQSLSRLVELASAWNEYIRDRAAAELLKRPTAIATPAAEVPYVLPHLIEADAFEDVLAVSRNLFFGEPENPSLLNNVAWLELVNGSFDRLLFLPRLEAIVQEHPDQASFRSTLVLALLEAGELENAATAALPLESSAKDRSGAWAVLGLLKARQGDKEAALACFEEVDWSEMMTRERLYFRQLLRKEGMGEVAPLMLR